MFEQLADRLANLVEDLKNFKRNITDDKKEEILKDLEAMSKLAEVLNGITQKKLEVLRTKITLFLDDHKDFDRVIDECVKLQNQLWEL